MERHIAYVEKFCRICSKNCEEHAARKHNLDKVSDIVKEAYREKDGCDISIDNELTESKVVCQACLVLLKRWNKDWQAFRKFKQKNPNSEREFSSSHKLPDSIENPIIHLDHDCPCQAANPDNDEIEDDDAASGDDDVLEASIMDISEVGTLEASLMDISGGAEGLDTSVVEHPVQLRDDDGKTPSKLQR